MNFNMNNQPYMSSNMQNMAMPMMASPLATSPTRQMQFMPYPTPTCAPTPTSTTPQLYLQLKSTSLKINSIRDIKRSVDSIVSKRADIKCKIDTLTSHVAEVIHLNKNIR